MVATLDEINRWVAESSQLWLFLDYDGTLADFPAAPDLILVQPDIVRLVKQLASQPRIRLTVISGRKLQDIRELLPVEGIFLAGVYGVEILTPEGDLIQRGEYGLIRPNLDRIKSRWETLIAGRSSFFLEDKDWSLALHAQVVEEHPAREVLSAARQMAADGLPEGLFRQLVDDNFLEIAPLQAHKGESVRYLFSKFPLAEARLVYIGDDDKDIEAFKTVHVLGGINFLVAEAAQPMHADEADYVLKSPRAVRKWLLNLLNPL
jgi:trehalose 6-phosphate phosphatase